MEENMNVVYIKHFGNGYKYIGCTSNFEKRMKQHEPPSKAKLHYPIYQAMKEFNHYTEIVFETTDFEEALRMEEIVIQNFIDLGYGLNGDGLYNVTRGGKGSKVPMKEETKQKLREANSGENNPRFGKTHSEETRQKLRELNLGEQNPMYGKVGELNPSYGRKMPEEQKQHLREVMAGRYVGEKNPMYGKTHTDEVKKMLSEKNSGQNSSKARPKEWYETNVSRRDKFKRTCKRMGWNFEDFDEIESEEIYVTPRGQKMPKFYYVYNQKEDRYE